MDDHSDSTEPTFELARSGWDDNSPIGKDDLKLISVKEFMERYFHADSRPSKSTVWRWLRNGDLPSHKIRRQYWINPKEAMRVLGL